MTTLFTIFLFFISIFFVLKRRGRSTRKLPPGSLGIPIIGQSLDLLRAMRANTAEKWLENRIKKYGPISKLSLFGKPTVFLHGHAANKFIFSADGSTIAMQQIKSSQMIIGERTLLELGGDDHKRVRNALMLFLKPESLKLYVGKMEEEIRMHLEKHWLGKQQVTVSLAPDEDPNIQHNVLSSFRARERNSPRQTRGRFEQMMDGIWAVPVNLPFTRYHRSLKASKKVRDTVKELIREKRSELKGKSVTDPRQDLIACLLSIRNEEGKEALTEMEIVDNIMLVMVAGHDTSSILITFVLRFLANKPSVHAAVLQEQEEIVRSKKSGEDLTWEDLAKMKYTWRVAMETLRIVPPVFGGFRKALKDIEFGGYLIPKGWQIFWASSMTQMDKSIFPEPTKFDPNRFENKSSVPPYCFVAFGGGAHICPGNEFARIETLITIHYLVTRFTWKLCADNSFSRDPTLVPAQGLPVRITQKKPL